MTKSQGRLKRFRLVYTEGGKWCRCCSPKPRGLILAEAVQRLLDERDGLIHATADMQREIIDRFGGPDWMTALVEESARLSALAKHKNAVTETFARLRVLRQQWSIGQIESAIQICLQESLDE